MNAAELLEAVRAEGFELSLTDKFTLWVNGEKDQFEKWKPQVISHKPELIRLIAANDDLDTRIRRMADYWDYSDDDLNYVLELAKADQSGVLGLLERTEWRIANSIQPEVFIDWRTIENGDVKQ